MLEKQIKAQKCPTITTVVGQPRIIGVDLLATWQRFFEVGAEIRKEHEGRDKSNRCGKGLSFRCICRHCTRAGKQVCRWPTLLVYLRI